MKKFLSISVMLLAVLGMMTTFTSCDEETAKEFLTDFYLIQADHYEATMIKTSERGEYVSWAKRFQDDSSAKNSSMKFIADNFTCELTGFFATPASPCTFKTKGDNVIIQCDGKDFIRMTVIEPDSKVLEAKVEIVGKSTVWVKFDRIMAE